MSCSINACGMDLPPPRLPKWLMRAVGAAYATMVCDQIVRQQHRGGLNMVL